MFCPDAREILNALCGRLIARASGWCFFIFRLKLNQPMNRWSLVCLSAIFLLACEPSNERRAELVDIHVKQANSYLKSGQYRAANIEARNVIQKAPEQAKGFILMAKILVDLGQYKSALGVLDQSPEQSNNNEYIAIRLEALLGRGKFATAIAELENNPSFSDAQPIHAKLLEARALIGLKEVDRAREIYQILSNQDANNQKALLGLADTAILANELETAESLLLKAGELDSENIDIGLLQAKIAIARLDFSTAEDHLSDSLIKLTNTDTITPAKATILSALAEVLVKQGRSAEALIYTQILAEAFPGFEVAQEQYRVALQAFQLGEWEKASEVLSQLLEEFPNFENAGMLLAIIQYQQGDFDTASDYLNETIDPELVHPEITRLAALSNLRSNRPQQVMDMLEAFPATNNDAKLLAIYGQSALMRGDTSKGVNALERAIELEPAIIPAYTTLASYYTEKSPPEPIKALEYLRAAYVHDNSDPALLTRLAQQLISVGEIAEAEQLITEQLTKRQRDAVSLQLAGGFYATQKDYVKATDFYEAALESDPQNYRVALQLAVIAQLKQVGYASVLNAYSRAASIEPQQTRAYEGMLRTAQNTEQVAAAVKRIETLANDENTGAGVAVLAAYFSSVGDIDKAENYLGQLNDQIIDPALLERTQLNVYYASANRSFDNAQYAQAKDKIFAALRLRPKALRLLSMLTEIEIINKQYSEAEKLVAQIGKLNEPLSLQLAGDLFTAKAEIDNAIDAYSQAWEIRPNELLSKRLYALLNKTNARQAATFLQQWLTANPSSRAAAALRSRDLLVAGEFNQAIPLLEKIRENTPDNVTNLNNLAWAYQQVGDARAASVAAKAYQLAPDTAAVADTYGWILYQNGAREQAIELLERAVELDSSNAEIAAHLNEAKNGA